MNKLTNKTKYQITKQNTTYFLYSNDYKFDERNVIGRLKRSSIIQSGMRANNLNEYSFTYIKEIDEKINQAVKRNYDVFNSDNNNYRLEKFSHIGHLEVFRIKEVEYFIESNKHKNGEITVVIYNFNYSKKWLTYLNNLKGNYLFEQPKGIKDSIINAATENGIKNIKDIAQAIEGLIYHSVDFHNRGYFEEENMKLGNYGLLDKINNIGGGIFWWKQKKQQEYYESQNKILMVLHELFISMSPSDFFQLRNFVNLWIAKSRYSIIDKGFQWGYSPFKDDVLNLDKKINDLFPDKKISLKNSLKKINNEDKKKSDTLINDFATIFKDGKSYSLFKKFHEIYKKEKSNYLANYSYVFEKMNANQYLVCSKVDFIKFLEEEYTIYIDKVDTRQSGKNRRDNLFDAFEKAIGL